MGVFFYRIYLKTVCVRFSYSYPLRTYNHCSAIRLYVYLLQLPSIETILKSPFINKWNEAIRLTWLCHYVKYKQKTATTTVIAKRNEMCNRNSMLACLLFVSFEDFFRTRFNWYSQCVNANKVCWTNVLEWNLEIFMFYSQL